MPENAYELCSNRLFISVTMITALGFQNKIISQFKSNDELLQACCASSTIPFVTEPNWCRYFRGKPCLDGGLTNNCPVFPESSRRQLIFRLSQIEYPWTYVISPRDTCIDALVIRGGLQMVQFLSGQAVPSIMWLEKKQSLEQFPRPGHRRRSLIAPLAASGVALYHLSGLGQLYEFIEQFIAIRNLMSATEAATVIRYSDLDTFFSENTLLYFVGIIYASIVSAARRSHLLL
jgi:predicted acylesterase/phospholipase RssA